ncbi:MAG: hypothetical protein ABR581_01375 [Thermoleophilaceae bacterium]
MRRGRRGWRAADRTTLLLGAVATGATGAVVAGEIARVWRRGSAPLPSEAPDLLVAAEEAVAETAEVARAGYAEVSTRENATFNMLSSFVTTFALARLITHRLRSRKRVGPFRDLMVGRRHIHHFVPGIVFAFASGAAAILTRDEGLEPKLAVPFGVGMGLTLDESALLLEFDDVYWSEEGVLSVQITLAVTAFLAAFALGVRFLRRGEQVVLDSAR